ncbi:dihydrolipoyllysine-residue succinyltransferase, E2 component [Ehrlichia chaffeensis str. Heartland]|uniref:Dihydrolipoyllysine-residue succinyltransferase component of 2-oxoglutarate dehydrogenase complex n=1 Tax=Ehrlichia chaffeensis (strain ATCC CRL-10679 / Arkansas) TaxID=205920 RepID=Q2GFD3_EHRCR|nr:2-oxoglutarate dehydrogenase complex dihydrolipoyllysine-residue succinyltransferase [Ehrlichia chaffeensis]ABD45186.1 2-oxoglutarate dehydrogenase, E2 component, dihydrolipoamide succinyltransferase [Ehrlichia chaffeensis str. Arkansas]AHX03284.1 dihydrolipoyllysine-residue succinyltransferase, E2 component [Ehrlichia chaffeensis str. Heartland]AHX05200.1 dihydrolipoyllysine-residue succinyltransferase, E2 component [Ehrlichia chaffeensis str. Jax]AHX06190.1 dihydrolipoyllysine-residue succ
MSEIQVKAENLGGESILEAPIRVSVNVGDSVKQGDMLFIIETDKTSLEIVSPEDGIINEIFVVDEEIIQRGQVLCTINTVKSNAVKPSEGNTAHSTTVTVADDMQQFIQKKDAPSAMKIMEENVIDKSQVSGSGIGGRITKSDVLNYMKLASEEDNTKANSISSLSVVSEEKREERVKMSKIRQVIAARLKESQNTAAILTTFNEVDMKNVMDLRAKYRETFEKKYGIKLGFMSFFIKAVVLALKELPIINAEISGNEIVYKHYYDMGIAVGTDKGLVVPVIRDADKMSFADLESTLASLGKKAREGKLEVADMAGATFTITNGGVYGSLLSTPIINPPQSGILGMHSIQKRPVAIDDKTIEIRPMMYIALSYDHRIVDGQGAVTFLVRIKQYIEDPSRMFLEV